MLRLVLSRLVDSQLGVFAMLNFAVSIYAVGALTTKVCSTADGTNCKQALHGSLCMIHAAPDAGCSLLKPLAVEKTAQSYSLPHSTPTRDRQRFAETKMFPGPIT